MLEHFSGMKKRWRSGSQNGKRTRRLIHTKSFVWPSRTLDTLVLGFNLQRTCAICVPKVKEYKDKKEKKKFLKAEAKKAPKKSATEEDPQSGRHVIVFKTPPPAQAVYKFSRMRSEGSRFMWGSGGEAVFAESCVYVRNRPQPFATVRNRPQPFA